MARDGEDPGTGEGRPAEEPKRDLRYGAQEEQNVRIERNLDGSGHLARGDKTRMSTLSFSSRHPARTERDPDFEFRPPPPKPAAAAPAPAPEAAAPPAGPEAPPPAEPDPSLMGKFKRMLGW